MTRQPSPTTPVSGAQKLWSIIGGRRPSADQTLTRTKTPRQPDFAAIQRPLVWLEEHSLSRAALLRLPKESLQYNLGANASLIDQLVARHLKSSIPPAQSLSELLDQHLQVLDQIFFYGNLTRHARRPRSPSAKHGGGVPLLQQHEQQPLLLLHVEDRFDEHNLITYYDGARRTIHMSASASAGGALAPRRRDELLGLLVYHMVCAYLDVFSSPAAGGPERGGARGGRSCSRTMAWEVEVFLLETIAGWFEDYKTRITASSRPSMWDERQQQEQSATVDADELALNILRDSFAASGASAPEVEAYWKV